jgi:hypothetical protein
MEEEVLLLLPLLLPLFLLLPDAVAILFCDRAVGMHTNIEPAYPTLASGLGIFSGPYGNSERFLKSAHTDIAGLDYVSDGKL